ncbi:MAG TPA: phage holin family protein [Candidatus Paceibacterota bacterium]|nr:phage holin family protein [Candidatus Paceibacterota bacterium]
MIATIVKVVLLAVVLMGVAQFVPGITIVNFYGALLAALILALLNLLVRPVLLILTIPINILTLGLFTFVLNAILFALAAWLTPGFAVAGFMAAFIGALIVAIAHWIIDLFI